MTLEWMSDAGRQRVTELADLLVAASRSATQIAACAEFLAATGLLTEKGPLLINQVEQRIAFLAAPDHIDEAFSELLDLTQAIRILT